MADGEKNIDMVQEARDEEKSAGGRKRGGKVKRARGGMMAAGKGGFAKGMAPSPRPDRRARGGSTSDKSPYTAAGNMSEPAFTKGSPAGGGGGGMGGDMNPYSKGGSHRRPG